MHWSHSNNLPLSKTLEIYSLGVVDHASLLLLQEQISYEIAGRDSQQGVALICEHPPVVTIGREGGYGLLHVEPEELANKMVDLRWISRGGGNLVHSPGQLCVYLMLPLDRLGWGIDQYLLRLQTVVEQTCLEFRTPVDRQHDGCQMVARTGAVGFLGTAIKSWVTQFGFCLNVEPDLSLSRMCHYSAIGVRPSSLAVDRMKKISTASVRECLSRYLADLFGYNNTHWYTSHPLLTRTLEKVHVHA